MNRETFASHESRQDYARPRSLLCFPADRKTRLCRPSCIAFCILSRSTHDFATPVQMSASPRSDLSSFLVGVDALILK